MSNLQQHAFNTGNHWMQGLQKLQAQHPIIGQVRGSGLFLGVELIRDAKTLEPADWEATYIVERMKERGILLSTEGPHHNVLKLKPPMVFRRETMWIFSWLYLRTFYWIRHYARGRGQMLAVLLRYDTLLG